MEKGNHPTKGAAAGPAGVTSDFAEPRGNWEHTAYQTDTRFIMEVKQQIEDPNRLVKPGFVDERWRTAERS
jgi:hypothetical protein